MKRKNPKKSYSTKHQKHIACSYSYKLICVDGKFRKPFNLGKNEVYNFINSMIKESKYCSDVMKKTF